MQHIDKRHTRKRVKFIREHLKSNKFMCFFSCDYLTLYDPDYLERTLSTISQNTSFSMTTETRRLTITFCRHTLYDAGILFSLYVDILGK